MRRAEHHLVHDADRGAVPPEEDGFIDVLEVGYSVPDGYGSLDDDTFTYDGVQYTVTRFLSGAINSIIFATSPDLPLGNGLALHVQRVVGEVDLLLGETQLSLDRRLVLPWRSTYVGLIRGDF